MRTILVSVVGNGVEDAPLEEMIEELLHKHGWRVATDEEVEAAVEGEF